MISKDHLTELPISIDCSAVSQLPPVENSSNLSDETLLLVSQPGYQYNLQSETDTGYISRYTKLQDIATYTGKKLDIEHIYSELEKKFDLSDVYPLSVLSCENVKNPYIISSFHFDGITLSSIKGYLLKDVIIDTLSSQLEHIIPSQLDYRITYDENTDCIIMSNQSGKNISSAISMGDLIEKSEHLRSIVTRINTLENIISELSSKYFIT